MTNLPQNLTIKIPTVLADMNLEMKIRGTLKKKKKKSLGTCSEDPIAELNIQIVLPSLSPIPKMQWR